MTKEEENETSEVAQGRVAGSRLGAGLSVIFLVIFFMPILRLVAAVAAFVAVTKAPCGRFPGHGRQFLAMTAARQLRPLVSPCCAPTIAGKPVLGA